MRKSLLLGAAFAAGVSAGSLPVERDLIGGLLGGLINALTQTATNGASLLGLLTSPTLPTFLNGPLLQGSSFPWGFRTVGNTDPYDVTAIPNTGVTRNYEWTITNITLAPDGVSTPVLVANGAFPGPMIEANWGDMIQVIVHNQLSEGTSLHWHGFLQTGTPYMDGTPGITQCPIAPGASQTYLFRAELYGTSWWHAHYSAQYINGLAGPIVVYGPKSEQDYDVDLGPVMLSDWFHSPYQPLVEQVYFAQPSGPILPPMSNNMLINGKANYPCSKTSKPCTNNAGLAKFQFHTGKKHLLRLINHSAEAIIFFSIDGYTMTVIANDFVPVTPYHTDLVTLGVGQRTDIIVQGGINPFESVWMRITEGPSGLGPAGETGCSLNDGIAPMTTAAIYYENANTKQAPTSSSLINPSRYLFPNACQNQGLQSTVPSYVMPVKQPDRTVSLLMTGAYNSSGAFTWYLNNVTFQADYNDPVLLEAKVGNDVFPEIRNVLDLGDATSVRFILTSVGFPASHPMHIHGHNFQVLSSGLGSWNGQVTNSFNPQRRDTHLVPPNGYAVVQMDLANPGTWAFHCHIAWHISEGMNINLIEQKTELQNVLSVPGTSAQQCRDWAAWTGGHVVDQIDSGL